MTAGIVELLLADFDTSDVTGLGSKAESLFFPASSCDLGSFNYVYAYALLLVWTPSIIIASLIWPLWMLSLQLGVVLCARQLHSALHCTAVALRACLAACRPAAAMARVRPRE